LTLTLNGGDREKESKLNNPIVFIQAGENGGFAAGNNIGIKYALAKNDFEYVCLLNNDTVVDSNFLSELSDSIKLDKNIGIVGGKILQYSKPDTIWYEGGKLDLFRGSGYHLREGQIDKYNENIKKVSFITGCLMLIKKDVFYKVGLLREEYFLYIEDPDFCYRCLKEGFYLYVNLASRIYHKVSASLNKESQKVSPLGIYYNTRNRLYFMLKVQDKRINKIIFLVFFIPTRIIRAITWYFKGDKDFIKVLFRSFNDFLIGKMGKL
jgi:GT2 family glycosyltransferase